MGRERQADINRIMLQIDTLAEEVIIDAALTLNGILKDDPRGGTGLGTPIDTGYASNKWDFAVTNLPGRIADPQNITLEDVTAAAIKSSQSQAQLFTYRIGDGPVFVFNDTNYIEYLNNGSSRQAPSMFVEQSADLTARQINRKYNAEVRRV